MGGLWQGRNMRAAVLQSTGSAYELREVPEPEVGDGEVLVDVAFASINPLDIWVSQGNLGDVCANGPHIGGVEGTGRVDGRPVLISGGGVGLARAGSYAERVAVPAAATIYLPADADLAAMAAVAVAGRTAYRSVYSLGEVHPHDRVLVLGASGGVGTCVTQLCAHLGAQVWGQSSSAAKVDFIESQGAERAIVADEATLADAVSALNPTVVFDGLGGGFTVASVEALSPKGRLVIYGTSSSTVGTFDLRVLYRKGLVIKGYSGIIESQADAVAAMNAVVALIEQGAIRSHIDAVLGLDQVAEAHGRILNRQVTGKLLVAP
jgi:NADPH:quinone reductase